MPRGRRYSNSGSVAAAREELAELEEQVARLMAQQAPIAASPAVADPSGPILHLNVPLLLASESHLMVQVRSDSKTQKFVAEALTDRACLVVRGTANDLIRGLIKAGHTPKVNE